MKGILKFDTNDKFYEEHLDYKLYNCCQMEFKKIKEFI